MLYDKKSYLLKLMSGEGEINTEPMKGVVEHLIMIPDVEDVEYDVSFYDMSGDEIYRKNNHAGRMDCRDGIIIGVSSSEFLRIEIKNATHNTKFKIIIFVKEG